MKAFATGHRPADLPDFYGYNLESPAWREIITKVKKQLLDHNITDAYTGMALGYDQAFALAVIQLQKEGHHINLHAVIPCKNQAYYWKEPSKRLYNYILSKCTTQTIISHIYTKTCMLERNRWMVDHSDIGIVFYDQDKNIGGTAYTVKYAISQKKEIINIYS